MWWFRRGKKARSETAPTVQIQAVGAVSDRAPKLIGCATAVTFALSILTLHAEIPTWLQWLPADSPALSVLYRAFPTPAGSTNIRRPPRETASQLVQLSAGNPMNTELVALSAREFEAQLDFVNAEARGKLLESISPDRPAARIALADYYHRRLQPQLELQTLAAAAAALPPVGDRLQPDNQQRAWKVHERIQQLIQAEAMPASATIQDYEAWIAKYPEANSIYQRYFDFVLASATPARAAQILTTYQQKFPNDRVFSVHAKAALAEKRRLPGGALGIYDAAFDPLWPPELIDSYFKLLTDSHKLYEFYQAARKDALARPLHIAPAARLFHYYRKQADVNAARRELAEFRVRKEAAQAGWTAQELSTLAKLSDSADDYEEVVRYSYALYSLPGADGAAMETALVQIIQTLLKAPDRPIRFGLGNLSFYRDVATIDSSPGFLNGILSLIFNSQNPDTGFATQDRKSQAYFHRAKAAELYALLSDRFPQSAHRSELLSKLIESYALYGDNEAIIRQGAAFIAAFPDAQQRTNVALQVADAHARLEQFDEEIAVYNRLLSELAAKVQHVPLGDGPSRSPDYARVLERYIARLQRLNRIADALAVYRQEINRNPDDPGLYNNLAAFLGANQRAAEVEQVYRQAMQRFQDPSWSHKLARFYLRNRMSGQFQNLSREVTGAFSGSDLEKYIADVAADQNLERRLQLEINVYAHTRFPHDLQFVHNLTSLYSSGATADAVALTRLLEQHWYEDETLRRMYFERLAAAGALPRVVEGAVNLLPAAVRDRWPQAETSNPAVTRFIAEAEAWQSHFEKAAPVMRAIAVEYPADASLAGRAADVFRSLSAYDSGNTSVAVSIADNLSRSEPRDRARLTRIGEIYADRDQMAPAAAVWARHASIEPGKPDGYLEAATLSWDYLRPVDALAWLRRGRTNLKNPTLWTYEMGAIFEAQNRRSDAVAEYLKGALNGNGNSQARLLQLAPRKDYRTLVDTQTKQRAQASPADPKVLQLRINVMREQKRSPELEPLLASVVDGTASREILSYVREVADQDGLRAIRERAIRREVQLESDPQEQLRLRLEVVQILESGGEIDAARREVDSIYQSNPLISGVIRAAADFYWRHEKPGTIRILRTASERAHASLKKDYLLETVRKAIEAGLYPDAIQSAAALLQIDPINGEFIAAMADALAASGRDADERQLYVSKIAEIQQAQISPSEKTDRIALMRRGLIPVLVRQNQFREALEQYIETINRFPDDDVLLAEAGRLASQHDLRSRLIDYYAKTVADSPRDPRWAIVLARVQTQFENYPAAIDAYAKAMTARPERQDLAVARAGLEERTFRFADAIDTYNRIYELSHGDPLWLERIAVLQARLGKNQEAIASLQRGYIDNRPESNRQYGHVARVLEDIGMIPSAADFIERQIEYKPEGWQSDYARIMTRARRHSDAFQKVLNSRSGRAMGEAVRLYFAPEEREAFAALIIARRPAAGSERLPDFIQMAAAAHLYDLEVRWSFEQMAELRRDSEANYGGIPAVALQQRRMRFTELAAQLEEQASKLPVNQRLSLLTPAMQAYQAIGDALAELRLFESESELQRANPSRYYELLARLRADQLVTIAGRNPTDALSLLAAQALVAVGDSARALQAVQAQRRDAVWTGAYTGLVGLYFGSDSAAVRSSFQRVLGSSLIQDRIGKPLDRSAQLAGNIWFYYGQRYAEYLRDTGQQQASSDYIFSQLEQSPGDPDAYIELARYYRDAGEPERALAEFRHALELDTKRADIDSTIALLLWDRGRRDEALAQWKIALGKFVKTPRSPAGPLIFRDIRSRRQEDALHGEVDAALRAAIRTLPVWQLPPLLSAAFENSKDDSWLLDIVQGAATPAVLYRSLAEQSWLTESQRKLILGTAVRVLAGSSGGDAFQYQQLRQRYLEFLINHRDAVAARQLFDSLTEAERRVPPMRQAELQIAALEGTLAALLDHYRQAPPEAPEDSTLQQAATDFERDGFNKESQQVLEFLYSRQIENFTPNAPALLGLAEIRLKQGRADDAVSLLRRLNLISPVPFENLVASARVLSAGGRASDAEEFLKLRTEAVPWDDEARFELAKLQKMTNPQQAAADLQRVVTSSRAAYDVRTQAAREQGKAGGLRPTGDAGSRELDLLSGRIPLTPESASAPYFLAARIAAADESRDPNVRIRLLTGAIAEGPDDQDLRKRLLLAAIDARQYYVAVTSYRRGFPSDPEISRALAEAHMQIGEFAQAASLFGNAAASEKDAGRKQALEERQKETQAANAKRVEDERRRPVMRAGLDQPNAVRRRLP